MYAEVSGNLKVGDRARLLSPRFPSTAGSCLQFYYHMYGATIGTLNVYVKVASYWSTKIWTKSGNQTNTWNVALVPFSSRNGFNVSRYCCNKLNKKNNVFRLHSSAVEDSL